MKHRQPVPDSSSAAVAVFYPGIDALRAVATLLVLFHHYFHPKYTKLLPLGWAGVDIFFVISGFLITGTLLRYRDAGLLREGLKIFYWRRILRVFPLYYLYLAIAGMLVWSRISLPAFASLIFYYTNYFMIGGGDPFWIFRHLWSLAVEEQFYLVWPLLVLTIGRNHLQKAILVTIGGSLVFSFAALPERSLAAYMHLAACVQALAAGGLLTLLHQRNSRSLQRIRIHGAWLILAAVTGYAITLVLQQWEGWEWTFALLRPFASFAAFAAIALVIAPRPIEAAARKQQSFNWFAGNGILLFIGKISYGIYIYHSLVRFIADPLVTKLVPQNSGIFYVVITPLYTLLTIGVAYLSYRFIERPINRLKHLPGQEGVSR